MRPEISYFNRSIEIDYNKYEIYYGENELDEYTGDYCLTIKKNGKEVYRKSNAELLDIANGESPLDLVLAGMVQYFCR